MSDSHEAIVIFGMHRSGTSCVSNLLTKCGVYFGNAEQSIGANEENQKGFFERRDIRWVCDAILQGLGCDWWAVTDFSAARIPLAVRKQVDEKLNEALHDLTAHGPWFVKEPRLCLVWPAVENAISNPVFLHVWRDPIEVARSLAARNGFPLDFGLALWEIYVRSAFRTAKNTRSIILSYNALLSAPKVQTSRLVKKLRRSGIKGIALPSDGQILDAVESKLYRQRGDDSLSELLTASQRRLKEALTGGDADHPELSQPVSAVSIMRIEDWVRREGATLALKSAAFNARGAMAEAGRLRTVVSQIESDLKAARDEQARVFDELKAAKDEHARMADESRTAERQHVAANLKSNAERSHSQRRIDELSALERRHGQELAALAAQRSSLETELREVKLASSQFQVLHGKDRASLHQQTKDLVALLSARDQELSAERARLEAADAERALLKEEVAALREQLVQEATVERKRLEDELIAVREQAAEQHDGDKAALAESLSRIEQAQAQIQERDARSEVLMEQIAARDTSLESHGETYDQLVKQFALVREDLKRRDTYVEKIKGQIPVIRKNVTRQFARTLDQAEAISSIKVKQLEIALGYSRTSQISLALQGLAAKTPNEQSNEKIHRGLTRYYSYIHRRKDAADLATIALSGLFDPDYYLKEYGDVAKAGRNPLLHFVDFGVSEHRNPSALFDTSYYLSKTENLPKDTNPVLHYLKTDLKEGRPPKPAQQRKVDLGNWALPAPPPPLAKIARKPFITNKRVVVYTAVSGGYDVIEPPAVRPPNCDFVIFSDQPIAVEGWQVRPINYLHADPTRAARFTKLHPHIYFPDYEYSIWLDGNITARGDVREFLGALTDESSVGIFIHPLRRCIYVEGEECIKRKKDAPDTINKHLDRYREAGFPRNAGLWETNVLARRHNDPRCIALMDAWWREMEIGTRRDQLSLPVVANRLGAKIAPLGEPGANARDHDLVALSKHPAERHKPTSATFPASVRKTVDAEAIPLDVGVCVYNSPAESRACIESVLDARGPNDTIIIVDDASDGQTAEMLDAFARNHERLNLIRHEQNRGYTQSANDVLKNAKAPWSLLLNSDTIVPPRAFRKIIACGEQFDRIGIVGPLSNAASWQSVPRLTGPDGKFKINEIPPGLSIADMDLFCEEASTGIVPFVPLLNGFCYAVRRKLTETIGFLDEASFPVGYGEEDDFSLRAGAAGYVCAIATDAYIYHTKSATFTADRRRPLVEQGTSALRRKHSPERLAAAVLAVRQNPELARVRERLTQKLGELIAQGAE